MKVRFELTQQGKNKLPKKAKNITYWENLNEVLSWLERGWTAIYEYKFVKVNLGGVFTRKPKEDHHRLIEEYARNGWRLVQVFSPAVSVQGGGTSDYFEIIFEKKVRWSADISCKNNF